MVTPFVIFLWLLPSMVCAEEGATGGNPEQAIIDRHDGFTSYTADLLASQMKFFQRVNAIQNGVAHDSPMHYEA